MLQIDCKHDKKATKKDINSKSWPQHSKTPPSNSTCSIKKCPNRSLLRMQANKWAEVRLT